MSNKFLAKILVYLIWILLFKVYKDYNIKDYLRKI